MSKEIITALFASRVEAENALAKLEHAGYTDKEMTMLITDDTRAKHFGIKENTKAEEGTADGAIIGGLAGAIGMSLISAGSLAIPGLNLIVSGTIIGGLVGLGAGAVTGGLVGALIGAGIPEHEAKLYENALKKGAFLLAIETRDSDSTKQVKEILKNANAKDVTAVAA